jgi:hypothetical protein
MALDALKMKSQFVFLSIAFLKRLGFLLALSVPVAMVPRFLFVSYMSVRFGSGNLYELIDFVGNFPYLKVVMFSVPFGYLPTYLLCEAIDPHKKLSFPWYVAGAATSWVPAVFVYLSNYSDPIAELQDVWNKPRLWEIFVSNTLMWYGLFAVASLGMTWAYRQVFVREKS